MTGAARPLLLPPERVSPYLRALQAGLSALAPHGDYVPLDAALAHLRALDPALSGGVLAPAEVDAATGLPGFSWMQRASAEERIAKDTPEEAETPDDLLARADRVEPELGARLRARRALHRFLRRRSLLPATELSARLKRTTAGRWDFEVRYDRLLAGVGWMRVHAELSGPERWSRGLFRVASDGAVEIDAGVQHLVARSCVLPLLFLRDALMDSLKVELPRLSRTLVGPFWYPGGPLPAEAPECASRGLILHLVSEVVGHEVRSSGHRDPLRPPPAGERAPAGMGLFRERRFAATPNVIADLERWSADRGAPTVVAPLRPTAG